MGIFDIFGGGGGGGDRVETRVDYPNWYIEQLRPLLGDLAGIYQGQAGQPLNQQQLDALAGMEGEARAGSPLGAAGVNSIEDLIARGGMAQGTGQFSRDLMGGGFTNPATSYATEIASGGFTNPAMKFIKPVARGDDVGNNPFLDAAYGRAAGNMTTAFNQSLVPGMDQSFAQSGRLGSGAYAQMRNTAEDQLGQSLGDLATGIYGGAYDAERQRQMQAQGLMAGIGQQDIGNRISGTGMLAGLGQQDVGNRMAGAGLLDQGTARQLQGIGLGGTANAMRYDDLARLYGVGQQQQQAPWMPGSQFMSLLNAPAGIGSGGVTTQPSATNPFSETLGGALGLGSLGLMIGGPMGIWPGVLGGAAAAGA